MVNDVLRDFINRFVFVYLDGILIFSKDMSHYISHVHQSLQRLLENKLYVRAEKCEFHASSVSFLGYIIESWQVRTDPEKVKAVAECPQPTTRKQLQRFLGFANFYRRHYKLTSSSIPFSWSPEAKLAFQKLKGLFTLAPILVQPDPSLQFMVEVDASDTGVGAVLSQRSSPDQKLHPYAYFSRRLTPAERNYDVGNRELLVVKLALEERRRWLEGVTYS